MTLFPPAAELTASLQSNEYKWLLSFSLASLVSWQAERYIINLYIQNIELYLTIVSEDISMSTCKWSNGLFSIYNQVHQSLHKVESFSSLKSFDKIRDIVNT